jgi:hypothetical protein
MTVRVRLSDLTRFAKENGYVVAIYERLTDWWYLTDENLGEVDEFDYDENRILAARGLGTGVDFRNTYSEDGQYMYVLHNTYRLTTVLQA